MRNAGVHAAGVVISPQPLTDLVPLHRTKNDEIVTAYDMKAVEKLGLLKMDFLGLTTLTIIDDALRLIEQTRNEQIDLQKLALDDQVTYEKVFHTGLTSGVFQFESHGMRDVLRRYKPTAVEDLTALNALYRPGPIQGGMIEDFIERKWGRKKIEYELPELEPILKETLGVIVYQEQVMQIANRLAGYSLGEADLLRRAMGKKDPEAMAKQRERFVRGASERGFTAKKIEKIFDLMEQFAGYGFNKSHSAAYALLAYQTAYLKTHYPVEFMAALLTSVSGSTDDVVKYINECREMGIAVEPPDVNVSDAYFTPHGEAIRFGLAAVKNVGHNAIESIVEGAQGERRVHVVLPVLREGRSAPAEQARGGIADQERRHGCAGPPRAADGRGRQRDGPRAEGAEGRGTRPARPVWRIPAGRRRIRRPRSRCPTLPTGMSTAAGLRERDSRLLHHRPSAGEISGEAGGLPRADHRPKSAS